ncbi:BTAD domain-containing putative transcriptional regulator [Muricoccus radiodurans]|uniref:BTAD domain-containing putative transcriptional regulator n=1 Tax=Muricoccus radiodurans TaxID=2231721 RepID=UPI003CF5E043
MTDGFLVEEDRRSDGASARPLSLSLLGPVQLLLQGREVRLRNRKARAVIAYLALTRSGEETRERLVGLLWSEFEEDKARASLRQVVHELREALPDHVLQAERLVLRLDPAAISLDVERVLRAMTEGEVDPLLSGTLRVADSLMEGLEDLDAAFREWVLGQRQILHDRLSRGLETMIRGPAAPSGGRRVAAQALLNLDPTHEEACRQVILAAATEGDTAGALRAYNALWRVLGDDHDMEPAPETQGLIAEIKSGSFRPPDPPPQARAEPVPSPSGMSRARMALVVEPFAANGVPADRAYIVHGFRHDLIACLARFREWYVLDGEGPAAPAGLDGRVSSRYSISATAYQAGQRISLVLTLRDADSAVVVWSERTDVALDTWFEAQQAVARSISMSLTGQVSAARLARVAEQPVNSLAAHDRWLRGQAVILRFSPKHWPRATALFEDAIAQDAAFSPAYSSLAQIDNGIHIAMPGTFRSREREARSLERARRAAALDPSDSRAQLCLGWSHAMAGQHEQAAPHMRLACELNPNDSWTLMSAALFHSFCGDHETAQRQAAASCDMTLAPSATHWAYEVTIAYLRGDDRATIEACDRAGDLIRTLPAWRAAALANLGDLDGARQDAERFFALVRDAWHGDHPPTRDALGRWLLHLYPISTAENWSRLHSGILAAGIPDGGMSHRGW